MLAAHDVGATLAVGDIDEARSFYEGTLVEGLRAKGVSFEHYDLPDTTRDGDIHELGGEMRGVWFKDPAGNIIALVNQ